MNGETRNDIGSVIIIFDLQDYNKKIDIPYGWKYWWELYLAKYCFKQILANLMLVANEMLK